MVVKMEYVLKQATEKTENYKARKVFAVGMTLYGYCGGIFGRDSYGDKKIVQIIGDYIEVEENGVTNYATVKNWIALLEDSNYELMRREKQYGEEE